ncbi:hypothetical protein EMIT0324P_110077 [Pseudomonas chlororaphis]
MLLRALEGATRLIAACDSGYAPRDVLATTKSQAQKRPLPSRSGLFQVATDSQKRDKFPTKNNKLRDCVQLVLFVGF